MMATTAVMGWPSGLYVDPVQQAVHDLLAVLGRTDLTCSASSTYTACMMTCFAVLALLHDA